LIDVDVLITTAFAVLAGAATALSPCVLPVLPVALAAGSIEADAAAAGFVASASLSVLAGGPAAAMADAARWLEGAGATLARAL
jgi:cytochrome c biogenesis protein CcdA